MILYMHEQTLHVLLGIGHCLSGSVTLLSAEVRKDCSIPTRAPHQAALVCFADLLTYFAGTKRLRSSNNEVAVVEHVSKKCCAVSSAAQQLVQTDQVCFHLHRLRCSLQALGAYCHLGHRFACVQ